MKKTFLVNILKEDTSNNEVSKSLLHEIHNKKDFELIDIYKDSQFTYEDRLIIMEEIRKRDPLLIMECINNLTSGYIFGASNYIKKLLIELVKNEKLQFSYRVLIIQSLENSNHSSQEIKQKIVKECEDLYIELFKVVYNTMEYKQTYEVSTTFFWDIFKTILSRDSIKTKLVDDQEFFQYITQICGHILLDIFLEEEFRYKLLQSLTKAENVMIKFKVKSCEMFISGKLTDYKYFIFVLQILKNIDQLDSSHLETLVNVFTTYELTINAKADICDFFLSLTDDKFKKYIQFGKDNLDNISFDIKESGKLKTIYNNGQNIHKIDVDQSIKPFIEKIINFDFQNFQFNPEDHEQYSNFLSSMIGEIVNFATSHNFEKMDVDKINHSIKRFILDNTLYSEYNVSLLNLLARSYLYILTKEEKDELMIRLCEELVDMSETCTTGHIYRLVNIFSGYDIEMRMPVEEEVKGCVFARLTKMIENKEEDLQLEIWDTIGEDPASEERFYQLLGKEIAELCDELKMEYVEQNIVPEDQLTIYVRRAISLFQIGERI